MPNVICGIYGLLYDNLVRSRFGFCLCHYCQEVKESAIYNQIILLRLLLTLIFISTFVLWANHSMVPNMWEDPGAKHSVKQL